MKRGSIVTKSDGTMIVTIRLTLNPERDQDLIDLINNAPSRGLAKTVREAMRNGWQKMETFEFEEDRIDLNGLGMEL